MLLLCDVSNEIPACFGKSSLYHTSNSYREKLSLEQLVWHIWCSLARPQMIGNVVNWVILKRPLNSAKTIIEGKHVNLAALVGLWG